MAKIEEMKKKMPKTGVKESEIDAIAEKHGVDPDLLKIQAPYLWARDYEEELSPKTAAESLATSVGKVGDMATLGFGKDAAIYGAGKVDPKMGDALTELRELADEREPEVLSYGTATLGGIRGLLNKGFKTMMASMKDDKDKDRKGTFGDVYGGARKDYSKEVPKQRKDMTQAEKEARATEVSGRVAERKEKSDLKEAKQDALADKSAEKLNAMYGEQSKQKDKMFESGAMEKPRPKTGEEWLKNLPDMTPESAKKVRELTPEQREKFLELFRARKGS